MGEPAERELEVVVDMVDYLRQTINELDRVAAGWAAERQNLAVRLAAMEAATDPAVTDAVADYEERLAEGRPYGEAEDATNLLSEAHRRYGT